MGLHCGLRQGWAGGLGSWDISSLWGFPEEGAALGNYSVQSPASALVASPEHAMGYFKIKCSLCCVQQVRRGLHWGLQKGWAGGWGALRLCGFVEISESRQHSATRVHIEPCQRVSGQSRTCHGTLKGQMQPLHCAAGLIEPALGAAEGLGRWLEGVAILMTVCGDFRGGGSTQ